MLDYASALRYETIAMEYVRSKEIYDLFKFSRQQLSYWRGEGLLLASDRTESGYYKYSFQDLVAIKTVRTLKNYGFSTQHIKKVFFALKERFNQISNPFVQKSIFVIGNRIAYKHEGKIYDALTDQGFFLNMTDSKEIEFGVVNDIKTKRPDLLSTFEKDIPKTKKGRINRREVLLKIFK